MKKIYIILWIIIALLVGISLGIYYAVNQSIQSIQIINGNNKISALLQVIDNAYVDTVKVDELIENALPQILSELDPHSSYINAEDNKTSNEDLNGKFSGIGVRFMVQKDTVNVMNVIKGGPSERIGILPGDRIIAADDSTLIGKENTEIMHRLRGDKGTSVKLTIVRHGHKKPLKYVVERGDVPVETVNAAFMLNSKTGYIAIESFGEKTYSEMLTGLVQLKSQGMKQLIVDLRGNHGGYLQTAIQMVNEFLPANRLIVYTEGRKFDREDYNTNGQGSFQQIPLIVMVDEASASAAEIFAGAIQDNDRGTIIGRRSFGKGLVQQPIEFKDGSVVRLTIARYYTPSGRCIQKPYEKGKGEEYENDLLARYERGEFFSADSIHQQGPEYHTTLGRTVYGGGGIMPDIFIPEDTSRYTSYYKQAQYSGLTAQFIFKYTDEKRATLSKFDTTQQLVSWLKQQQLVEAFADYASNHGLARNNPQLATSKPLLERIIIAGIIYNIGDFQMRLQYWVQDDAAVLRALKVFAEGASFPKVS